MLLTKLVMISALSAAAPAFAEEMPPAGSVQIDTVRFNGTGCRSGTAALNISPDRRALTLIFNEYSVDASTGQPSHRKKSCDIDVRMKVPDGWTFALATVDYRGYAGLEAGTSGWQESRVQFAPGPMVKLGGMSLTGPYDGDFQVHNDAPATRPNAPCSGPTRGMKLKTDIGVETPPRGGNAYLAVDSADTEVSQLYQIVWKRCR